MHDGARAILPAFGALTGSLNIQDEAFDGLLEGAAYEAIMLGTARLAVVAPKRLLPDRLR